MNIENLDPVFVEWAYSRELMRRLGFSADNLFFHISAAGEGYLVSLVLKDQNLQFSWGIGIVHKSRKDIEEHYNKLCSEWNNGTESNADKFMDGFRKSKAFEQCIGLISAIQHKGFTINPLNDDYLS